mgnify:CR=1 FL=1
MQGPDGKPRRFRLLEVGADDRPRRLQCAECAAERSLAAVTRGLRCACRPPAEARRGRVLALVPWRSAESLRMRNAVRPEIASVFPSRRSACASTVGELPPSR